MASRPARFAGALFHGQHGNLDVVGSVMIDLRGARSVASHVVHSTQN